MPANALSNCGFNMISNDRNMRIHFKHDIRMHLDQEHRELLKSLKSLSLIRGSVGESALNLLKALEPHVSEEEKTVIPLLSSIGSLMEGKVGRKELSRLSLLGNKLTDAYTEFLKEHSDIDAKAEKLLEMAKKTGNEWAVPTIEGLRHHIFLEELLLYPFSILVGKYAAMIVSENRGNH